MNWLLLVYKVPREPTSTRVYVWRKLKQIGAIALQDAVWVIPATPRTREQFQWLAAEIVELKGDATVFHSQASLGTDADALRERFEAPIREGYRQILAAAKRRKPDLPSLANQFQQFKDRDYFQCELGEQVRKRLLKLQGDE